METSIPWTPSPARILGSMLASVQKTLTPRMKTHEQEYDENGAPIPLRLPCLTSREFIKLVTYAPKHKLMESERAFAGLDVETLALSTGGDL
jgi:hypothetical protein